MPFPLVLNLQMATYQKIAILGYILTGALVIVAGIGRTVSYFTTDPQTFDWSYETYYWFIWSPIEAALGIVGVCLPTMKPLLNKTMPTRLSSAAKDYFNRSGRNTRSVGHSRRKTRDSGSLAGHGYSTLSDHRQHIQDDTFPLQTKDNSHSMQETFPTTPRAVHNSSRHNKSSLNMI
jgi:hypothetical protein